MPTPLAPDFRPRYHQLHRVGRPGVWRSVVGALLLIVLVFGVVPLVAGGIAFVTLLATGSSAQEASAVLDVTEEATPAGLALLNVIIAAAIPLTFLVTWWLHRLKPRWVSSVAPRLRWGYLLVCLGLSVVALVASLGVALLLPVQAGDMPEGTVNDFTTRTRDFLLVILLLTPLQAAGEEYLFRGYLTQAFGSLVWARRASETLAVLGPALIFALFHGLSQDWPVFFDRFAFGVVAGILVIRTGGLEAPIAMHVLNNFLAFGLALAFGDLTTALNAEGGSSWWTILSTMTQSLVYLGLATWVARAMGLVDTGPPVGGAPLPPAGGDPELVGPPPRV
ncbi:MAG TPA: type II CAAX endopeptidase family protein [Nocardioides sp.]|nr:type II CAAX endopeptidase family protein [Nocardioides sp.]